MNSKTKQQSIRVNEKTWQQLKSENTQSAILDATLDCFYELGYGQTTTEKVAKKAGVSRGAMLHHFPSRTALIRAAVMHLNQKRLLLYEETERNVNKNAEHTHIGDGIDAFWDQLKSPLFTVFHELCVAARTDEDLREIMATARKDIDRSWRKVTANLFPDLALSEEWVTGNLIALYVLEGMAMRGDADGQAPGLVVPWLKQQLLEMFDDVREVDRASAIRFPETVSASGGGFKN